MLGQQDIGAYLRTWEQSQSARFKDLQLQLTPAQLEVIEEAVDVVMPRVRSSQEGNPNARGATVYMICREYLRWQEVDG